MRVKRKLSAWVYTDEIRLAEQFAYGHREVLLASNDLDPTGLFLASIPHGWGPDVPGRPYPKVYKKFYGEYPILAWSSRAAKDLEVRGYRSVVPAGSPWAHLLNKLRFPTIYEAIPKSNQESNSLLYFPSHSIPGGEHIHDYNLENVLKDLSPTKVTVCLFWLDFINPKVRTYYSKFDSEIFCVGYKGSTGFDIPWAPVGGREMFIPTLLDLFERHKSIVFESVSTPFWYAASLRKDILILDTQVTAKWWGNSNSIDLSINNAMLLESVHPGLKNMKMNELTPASELLYFCAKKELGFEHVESFIEKVEKFKLLKSNVIPADIVDPMTEYIQLRNQTP